MKIAALLLSAVSAWRGVKEHTLIEQYLRTGKVTILDEERNGNRQWHDCGDKVVVRNFQFFVRNPEKFSKLFQNFNENL